MVYTFTCPHCGGSEYSSHAHENQEKIKCIYCGRLYRNLHYKGDAPTGEDDGRP